MGDIKSAFEIAMEKINRMDEPTEAERAEWKYLPEGEKLAGRFIKDKANLLAELEKYDDDARTYVVKGASAILARNIALPVSDYIRQTNKKMMDGLKLMKNDKTALENTYSKIRYIFTHYEEQGKQQKEQAHQALKEDFTEKIRQAMQQQLGTSSMSSQIDVEKQPQFQQEWKRIQTQIDNQYTNHLKELVQELIDMP